MVYLIIKLHLNHYRHFHYQSPSQNKHRILHIIHFLFPKNNYYNIYIAFKKFLNNSFFDSSLNSSCSYYFSNYFINSSKSESVSSMEKCDSIAARNSCFDIVFVLLRSIFLNKKKRSKF